MRILSVHVARRPYTVGSNVTQEFIYDATRFVPCTSSMIHAFDTARNESLTSEYVYVIQWFSIDPNPGAQVIAHFAHGQLVHCI